MAGDETDGSHAGGDEGEPSRGSDRGGGDSSDRGEGSDDVSTAEKIVMALSVAFALAIFGVAVWHALTGPGALAPTVEVVGSQPAGNGSVAYTVELRNPGDVGLLSATVEARCTGPPTTIVFENVPAAGRRRGTVVCPPGTTDPAVSVTSWRAA